MDRERRSDAPPGPPPGPPPRRPGGPSARPALPHELPSQSRNYQTTHDPQLSDAKEMRRRYETDPRASTSDPRLARARAPKPKSTRYHPRRVLECAEYEFDQFSVGPPPPCEIVVAGLAPRTTPAQVLQQCRAFGPISASELKVDPQTGESIGIMWVCFASTGAGRSVMTAAAAAAQAQRTLDQQKMGLETVRVVLDRDRAAYVAQYRALLGERYARKREERARALAQRRAREKEERASPARQQSWRTREWRAREAPSAPQPHSAALPAAVAQRLAELGHPYVFVPRVQSNALSDALLRDLVAPFSPVLFERDAHGLYVGFAAKEAAARCRMVLETRAVQGGRLRLEVRDAPRQAVRDAPDAGAPAAPAPARTTWTHDELIDEATRRILSDLATMLARDIKTRTVTPLVTQFLRPDGDGGRWLAEHKPEPVVRRVQPGGALPSFKRLDAVPKRAPTQKAARREARPAAPAPERSWDPVSLGLVQDAEEMYYLRELLAREARGEAAVPDAAKPAHEAGSARAQGFYRIPAADKAAHLPDRNRAAESGAPAKALASARNNRADSRRLALDLEQHKRETLTDTDILHINQLQTRKKQLRFAKSPIHDWGLYAMELIPPGEMVIEYVGEVVRQQVADHREKMYERAGNFSTYLFRVDDDVVVDATNKGNIARLMNHCCTPNCTAKILTVQGEKRAHV
ncbi:[histone H3]-lysine(4) N-trimethyltransferase [Malassezia caprae]|uniref:Histone-lysine N-methyltransferase, H3 lysine-4 specific n=1 Tax=Malassezia caprae TaxID=1381934 RepID=A0AAF0E822_9BASI|nr:[histone H3]-lysine(4) N-trimethyltransferase [Malassezia caprae]